MVLGQKIKKIFVFYMFLSSFSVLAQTQRGVTLSGVVRSSHNKPLENVSVFLKGTKIGAQTDINGQYVIASLPANRYTIVVSYMGYETIFKAIEVNNTNLDIDFTLTESTEELDEIAIQGKTKAEKNRDQGYVVNELDLSEIQTQSLDLNTLLNQSAGIRVRQAGGLGSRADYSINGLSGKSVRFFLDGVPMDYFGSSFSINSMPVSLIDKIEIYKGIIPVELGSDALGGAVNLVTKNQLNNKGELAYSFGSFNTHRVSFNGTYRHKKSGLTSKIAAFYNYSDNNYKVWGKDVYVTDPNTFEIQRNIKVERFHDAFESKAVKFDLGFTQKSWADHVFLGIIYSDLDKEIQHGSTMEVPFGEATYTQKVATPYLTYKKKNLFKNGLHLDIFTSYSNLIRKRVDTSRNIYNWYGKVEGYRTLGGEQIRTLNTLNQDVFLNRMNLVYHLNSRHKLGYNYIFSDLKRTDSDPLITQKTEGYYAPQKLRKHSMALALQSKFVDSKFKTSLFLKYYAYNARIKTSETSAGVTTYNTETTDASGLGYGFSSSYAFSPRFSLNASLEKTYRLPESEEILGDGLNIISTTLLQPETSLNANLGCNALVLETAMHELEASGNLFYRNVSNLIQLFQYDSGAFVYINFDKVLMQGIDANLQYRYKKWFTLNQVVSYLNPLIKSDTDEYGNRNVLYNSRLPNTPFFQSNTEARVRFRNVFQEASKAFVYYNVNFIDEFHRHSEIIGAYNKDIIPKQWEHNFGIGYTFPKEKITLSFDLRNIYNAQLFDNYAVQKPGRGAYGKMIYNF